VYGAAQLVEALKDSVFFQFIGRSVQVEFMHKN